MNVFKCVSVWNVRHYFSGGNYSELLRSSFSTYSPRVRSIIDEVIPQEEHVWRDRIVLCGIVVCVSVPAWKITRRFYLWCCDWIPRRWMEFTSWMTNPFIVKTEQKRRTLFQNRFHLKKAGMVPGHSHGESARTRTGASWSIDDFITSTGRTGYTVSLGSRDEPEGQRLFYHTRDYCLNFCNDKVKDTTIFKMVDVDYYADMNYWLSFGKSIILYTFIPTTAGGPIQDGNFSINSENVVTTRVNGGATYNHKIWDYNHDYVTVETFFGVQIVAIDQMIADIPTRRVIQLTPQAWVPWPFSMFVTRNPLKRKQYSFQDWIFVRTILGNGEQTVSIARGGSTYCVTLTEQLYEAIRIRHKNSKSHRNIADIERFLRQAKYDDPHIKASLLFDFLEKDIEIPRTEVVVNAGEVPSYQTLRPLITEDGKSYARNIGPPLFSGSKFPAESYNNDVTCVAGRVVKTHNNKVPPNRYSEYANKFLKLLIPDEKVAKTSKFSVADVIEFQDKPLQRVRSEKQKMWGPGKFLIKAFQKRESYQKIQDPRNISSCPTDHTLKLSQYTLAFKEQICMLYNWFVPGRTPVEITELMSELAGKHEQLLNCDFSRLDGTISRWLRERIMHAALLRGFGDDSELIQLLQNEMSSPGVTMHGVRYDSGYGQKSGSPLTTIGNTLVTAFFFYCAFRVSGYDSVSAFDNIGMMYGDDAITGGLNVEQVKQVADDLGLSIKTEIIPHGRPVTYLGRTFVDPWSSSTTMQDIKRTLSKIHTSCTSTAEVTAEMAIMWKAFAYTITDARTPILKEYCEMVLRILNANRDELTIDNIPRACRRDLTYWLQYGFTDTWPQAEEKEVMEEVVCESLGIDGQVLDQIVVMLENAKTFKDVLPLLDFIQPEVQVTVAENGVILEGEKQEELDPVITEVIQQQEAEQPKEEVKIEPGPSQVKPKRRKSDGDIPRRSKSTDGPKHSVKPKGKKVNNKSRKAR